MYMKKKALDDDLMFSKPPELLLLQVFTQLDFVDHLFESNSHKTHFHISDKSAVFSILQQNFEVGNEERGRRWGKREEMKRE